MILFPVRNYCAIMSSPPTPGRTALVTMHRGLFRQAQMKVDVLCSQPVISHSITAAITQLYLRLLLCFKPVAIINGLQVNEMCVSWRMCLEKLLIH